MKGTFIFSEFDVGDTVWLLVKTSSYNGDFKVVYGHVTDVVTCITNGEVAYKMRLADGTVAVENYNRCFKSKEALAEKVLHEIERDFIMLTRMKAACDLALPQQLELDTEDDTVDLTDEKVIDLCEEDETKET